MAPFATVDSSEETTWRRAGGPGWLRGLSQASVTDEGLLRIPGGSGPLWFWPAVLVLLADLRVAVATVLTARALAGDFRRRTQPSSIGLGSLVSTQISGQPRGDDPETQG